MWLWRLNKKLWQKHAAKLWALKQHLPKSSDIVLHDNEILRPQELNKKIKNEDNFYMEKEFLGYVFSAWRSSNFYEKEITKNVL